MNKRGGLITTIIIAVVAGIVGAVLAGWILPTIGLSPAGVYTGNVAPGSGGFVNAHACNADGTCEVNALISEGSAILKQDIIFGNNLQDNMARIWFPPNNRNMFIQSEVNTYISALNGSAGLVTGNGADAYTRLNIYEDGRIEIRDLKDDEGDGLAYVCVDNNGVIFRSENSCDNT